MNELRVELDLLEEQVKKLPQIAPELLERASDILIGLCQFNTPVRTGKLIQSYGKEFVDSNTVNVFNDAPYAAYVEFNHRRYMMTKAIDEFESSNVMKTTYDEIVEGKPSAFDRFIGMEECYDDTTEDYTFIE